ncbi:cytochrome b/b6 domain-containing protein [Limnohabitans sp. 103DPR2]|uniref:cytochrome b/b6 domain-containing protein n=1 Tax=Limnohabitans sp. 103DPR2 TaxID=1678129 RepID=UPI0006DC05D8|nr:cytochrome b/b6 domain-containing protein [Limnohabitans sp. 103DPR2]ALK90784.1 putative Ni/Fe-hydrogenase B-type cytochrome subunit [Limnohabitans sp. 103DPR2]
MNAIRVWDLPTRLFHWTLALLVLVLVITGNVGGNAMVWHFRCGYAVLSLLLFRLLWGFVGGHWSRWRQLSCTPSALRQYFSAQSSQQRYLGHNPIGSLSVIALMSLLLLQVATGLFSDDEIANAGPLTVWVSESIVSMTTQWHKGFGKGFVLLLIAIHVGAILWYFVKKKENLSRAMLWGDKSSESPATASLDRPLDWLKALLCLALVAALVFVLINAVPSSL